MLGMPVDGIHICNSNSQPLVETEADKLRAGVQEEREERVRKDGDCAASLCPHFHWRADHLHKPGPPRKDNHTEDQSL